MVLSRCRLEDRVLSKVQWSFGEIAVKVSPCFETMDSRRHVEVDFHVGDPWFQGYLCLSS